MEQTTNLAQTLSLTERLRQIEANEFIEVLNSSKNKGEEFETFVQLLSTKPCSDSIVLHNLRFMYEYILEGDYEAAEATIQYFINRGTMFLIQEDIDWKKLTT